MKQARIPSYDLIKTIAIFLVCFYHCSMLSVNFLITPTLPVYFNYWVYGLSTVGVPLFFMINGALLFNRSYDIKKHALKTFTLLMLLIVWGGVSLLLLRWMHHEEYSTAQFVKYFLALDSGHIGYLWFLKALIYLYIFFPFLKALFDSNKRYLWYMLFFIFVMTFFKFIPYIDWINPFNGIYSYTLVYFILGGLLVHDEFYVKIKTLYLIVIAIIAAMLLFAVGIYQSNLLNSIYDTVWEGYDMIIGLVLSSAFFILLLRIKNSSENFRFLVKWVGDNTLGIYFIHLLIARFIFLYYPLKDTNLLIGFLFAVSVLFLSLGITLLFRKIPVLDRLVKL